VKLGVVLRQLLPATFRQRCTLCRRRRHEHKIARVKVEREDQRNAA
jgi:hypothetical protein